MRRSFYVLAAMVLVASLFLSGCPAKKAEKTEITIVAHTSLTGELADYGYAANEAIKLAVKDMSPFKVGDTEYTIKLISMDDKGDEAESAVVAQNAVDKKATAVIGALTSGNTNAALPVYKKVDMPMISGSATRPDLTAQGYGNFFRTCIRDDIQGKVLGGWAADLGYKKIAVVDDKGDYAVALADVVEKALKERGVKTLREHAPAKDTDFAVQINNIKNFGADAVIFTGYHLEAGLLRKQMVEKGMKNVKMMGGDGIKSELFVKEAGGKANAEGVLCTFGLSQAAMPEYPKFKTAYEAATGKKGTGPYAENNYDAVGILIKAIQKAGTTDRKAIVEALGQVSYDGVIGPFSFNEKGDIKITGAVSKFIIKNGAWTTTQ